MIGVEGQYLLNLQVGKKRDFLSSVEMEHFEIIEQAGPGLPIFLSTLVSRDPDLARYFNEGQTLSVQYGKDRNSLQDSNFVITASQSNGMPDGKRRYHLEGLLDKLEYLNVQAMRTTPKVSALEAMHLILKRHNFSLTFDLPRSADSQVWIQPSQTDRAFIEELWLHAHLPGSFPMIAIAAFNDEFICRDARTHFVTKPRFTFTPNPRSASEYPYGAGSIIRNASSFMNMVGGYNRDHVDLDREEGFVTSTPPKTSTFLALSPTPNRRKGISSSVGSFSSRTPNTHTQYNSAYTHNTQHLALFSSFRILSLPIRNLHIPIKPLDLVLYRDDVSIDGRPRSDEYSSGLFVVSKIHRVFKNSQHATFLDLSREAPGGLVGEHE